MFYTAYTGVVNLELTLGGELKLAHQHPLPSSWPLAPNRFWISCEAEPLQGLLKLRDIILQILLQVKTLAEWLQSQSPSPESSAGTHGEPMVQSCNILPHSPRALAYLTCPSHSESKVHKNHKNQPSWTQHATRLSFRCLLRFALNCLLGGAYGSCLKTPTWCFWVPNLAKPCRTLEIHNYTMQARIDPVPAKLS